MSKQQENQMERPNEGIRFFSMHLLFPKSDQSIEEVSAMVAA